VALCREFGLRRSATLFAPGSAGVSQPLDPPVGPCRVRRCPAGRPKPLRVTLEHGFLRVNLGHPRATLSRPPDRRPPHQL